MPLVGDANAAQHRVERWFDTGAFQPPEFGAFGNEGRNVIHGPGYRSLDFLLSRNFTVR